MKAIPGTLARVIAALLVLASAMLPAEARAARPMILEWIIIYNSDPEPADEPTTGTMARLDGSIYVCSWTSEGWSVSEYEASRYTLEANTELSAFDVSHVEDSTLIAEAILDSPHGPALPEPEQRGNAEYVFFVGRVQLLDGEEEVLFDSEGTYLVSGEGRVVFTRGE